MVTLRYIVDSDFGASSIVGRGQILTTKIDVCCHIGNYERSIFSAGVTHVFLPFDSSHSPRLSDLRLSRYLAAPDIHAASARRSRGSDTMGKSRTRQFDQYCGTLV